MCGNDSLEYNIDIFQSNAVGKNRQRANPVLPYFLKKSTPIPNFVKIVNIHFSTEEAVQFLELSPSFGLLVEMVLL